MKPFQLLGKELSAIVKNKRILIPIIAVLIIPLLYSGMFLWAFWDPYNNMEDLPVAVVNQDTGSELNGEKLEVGNDLVEKLKGNQSFEWHFVDKDTAQNGLRNRDYYMMIEIPNDFSERAGTVLDENPKPLEITYVPNESFNFLSAQIGETAVAKIKEEVANELSAAYAENLFASITEVSEGLAEAGDGAGKIHTGLQTATDGSVTLRDNLTLMAEKSLTFKAGALTAKDGSTKLDSGMSQVQSGTDKLLAGLKEKQPEMNQLATGAAQVSGGVAQLTGGLDDMKQNQEVLLAKMKESEAGAQQLARGLEQAGQDPETGKKLNELVTASTQLNGMIQELAKAGNLTAEQKQQLAVMAKLSQGVQEGTAQVPGTIQATIDQIKQPVKQLADGQTAFVDALTKFGEGIDKAKMASEPLVSGAAQLAEGAQKVNLGWNGLISNVAQLANAQQQLASGTAGLNSGLGQLADGAGAISDGSGKLAEGATNLTSGLEKLEEGSGELAEKLSDAASETAKVQADDETYQMFANPVHMKTEKVDAVPNYGTGFTPYFLSLGLYVGALILSIVLPLREPAGIPRTAFGWFFSKFGVVVLIGITQALLVDTLLLAGLDLQVESVPYFILFSIITSLTFITLIQFLVTAFGDPGRFIAILILILQLTTSAGTFPLELIPNALQSFNAWLPMTYTVAGFKAAVSSGDYSFMWHNVDVLLLFIGSMMLGTFAYFYYFHKRQYRVPVERRIKEPAALS